MEEMSNTPIWKFELDCGRIGYLYGLFIAEIELVLKLIRLKPEIYFGEVLGKHSEIISNEYVITLGINDESFVKKFKRYQLEIGYNPFDFCLSDGKEVLKYLNKQENE